MIIIYDIFETSTIEFPLKKKEKIIIIPNNIKN